MKSKVIFILFVKSLFLVVSCYASEIVFLQSSDRHSDVRKQVQLACQFYGLEMKTIVLNEIGHAQLSNLVRERDVQAWVIDATALLKYGEQVLSLRREVDKPILLTNIRSEAKGSLLEEFSDGTIRACQISPKNDTGGHAGFGDVKGVTRQLSGLKILFSRRKQACYFDLDKSSKDDVILQFWDQDSLQSYPIFVRTGREQEVFYLTGLPEVELAPEFIIEESSFKLVPLLMFLKYASVNYVWHNPKHIANFTIDDPWLTEPYGFLSYAGLLQEMEKVGFHTTISFIPWNFDRSQPEVVELFKNHPDIFSICIHGNNHDRGEFRDFDSEPSQSVSNEEADIRQALARMERFRDLTGISYDRIMVFPRKIGPAKALSVLKKYNFLATVNGLNVPIDSREPENPLFRLRPATLAFANFPSVRRYHPDRPFFEVALDLFLDNPVLFYTHHEFFEPGIDAFNDVAEFVNKIQPDIQWQNLKAVIQNLYLQKLRDDGNVDVLTFSNEVVIQNTHETERVYHIKKEESFASPIRSVTVAGRAVAFEKDREHLRLQVTVPAKNSRHIVIEYENDLDLTAVDVSKDSYCVALIRQLSDFRDLTLSHNAMGRAFIQFYYEYGFLRIGLIFLTFMIIILTVGFYYRKRTRRRRLAHST
ncbi:hypothetical protein GWO43_25185 [candidate division KSB1 bacterium]|nr:hypothetical protein [candidate division KSB1 bacterium]NIR68853.1 hypothetical protein [candidate division KSB1 bacterium]NIS27221.1 hypothetical protein [candidate division KSB1 bacterium]NIT74106.1 hypothetical protein [candidate division KSB1 bacterium]NIU27955.1 hypothetical protein [candidate division KSB1 bacterium]